MTTSTETATQTYQVYIRASAQQIWDALTTSEWTERYGYRNRTSYDFESGIYKAFATEDMVAMGSPEVMVEGEILEAEEPTRLVQTWHALFDESTTAEPAGRLTTARRSWPRSSPARCRTPAAAGPTCSAT
jgi:uncharacterized protein YndB with AHSA1/START domain